ncbi:hypothetical protein [Gordonia crocea]|uniref:Secreted protein n=1 Tax=Gordonia crocea TaxID=589162 RepID=A0A7I9UWW4_9ACTN|nr:hypothetical protein [Gordonia crocea]GED97356.1 hypothetical protein nbrc107697_13950 [Gordonia crocea]
MTVSPLRRLRLGTAVACAGLAVTTSLFVVPVASAKPQGAPIVAGGNAVLGNGCTYTIGVRVGPAKPARPGRATEQPAAPKAKADDGTGRVVFWETAATAKPGARSSVRIGSAKPNDKGVAVLNWTPRTTGGRAVWAHQKGWSTALQVTVAPALALGPLCLMSQ